MQRRPNDARGNRRASSNVEKASGLLLLRFATAIYRLVEPRATSALVAVCGLLWIASAVVVIALQGRVAAATGGLAVPDVSPLYTATDLYALLGQYGEPGRRAFLVFTLFDVVYPFVAYGFALLALAALARPLIAARPFLACILFLPIAGLGVELLEQVGFILILLAFPTRMPLVAQFTSGLSLVKLGLLLMLVLVTLSLLGWRARSGAHRHR